MVISALVDGTPLLFAQTRKMPSELLSQDFLRARSWKADKGLEAFVHDWPRYSGNQENDRTTISNVSIDLLGVTFEAQYRVFKSDDSFLAEYAEIALLHKDKYSENFCPSLLSSLTAGLGEPSKILDRSTVLKDSGFYHHSADWLIGQTRVKFDCSGMVMHGSYIPVAASLIYRYRDHLKPLEDLIVVECSKTTKYVGPLFRDYAVEQSAPVTLIIDPNDRNLLRRDKLPFLKTVKYTDDEIIASEDAENGKQDFRLDRLTGNYEWKIRTKRDLSNGSDNWGKCSRVNAERRF